MTDLAAVLAPRPVSKRPPRCKRCGRNTTSHTIKVVVNEVGPKRNGSGTSIGGRSRTLCNDCTVAIAPLLIAILDLDGVA